MPCACSACYRRSDGGAGRGIWAGWRSCLVALHQRLRAGRCGGRRAATVVGEGYELFDASGSSSSAGAETIYCGASEIQRGIIADRCSAGSAGV